MDGGTPGTPFADQVLSTVGVTSNNDGSTKGGPENARGAASVEAELQLDTAEAATGHCINTTTSGATSFWSRSTSEISRGAVWGGLPLATCSELGRASLAP
jgi:hypothetical protein